MNKFAGLFASVALVGTSILGVIPSASAATHAKVTTETIHVSILPGSKLGPDKIKHDAFSKTNFNLKKGEHVTFVVKNYDSGSHSITSSQLGLNIVIQGETKKGVPAVTKYTFTPKKAGSFHWQCVLMCDGQANGWAMSHADYMAGTIQVAK